MNQIFNFKRFWNFFKYDMVRTVRNNSTKFLSFVITPVCVYLLYGILSWIFGFDFQVMGQNTRLIAFCILSVIFFIYFSSYNYGFLTEKKEATSWLMIPASVTEKYITMILNVLIIAPTVYFVLAVGMDLLYSLLPGTGKSIISILAAIRTPEGANEFLNEMNPISITGFGKMTVVQQTSWTPLLAFLLGGLCFKKSKVAKTILCMIAFSTLMSALLAFIASVFPGDAIDLIQKFVDTPKKGEFLINAVIFLVSFVPFAALAVAVFFRLKTIKH